MASKYEYLIPEVQQLYSTGMNTYSIATKLSAVHGVSRGGFYDWLRKQNLKEPNNFETVLEANKFAPPEGWSHGWLKTEGASIFIKNKDHFVSYSDVRDDIIKEMKSHSPNYDKIVRDKVDSEEHCLIIDIADLHMGKFASESETGESYNISKATERALSGIEGILSKCSGYNIDKIYFIIGNDILHIDSPHRKTTAGTPQDTDGMWYEAFTSARRLYVQIIERLVNIADVHIIHCPSNHDFMSGFMLADSIYSWFHNHPNISFDVTNAHRKYTMYGNSLLGFSHGDGAKMPDYPLLMANEAKRMWAETEYRYIYLHHIHHKDINIFKKGKDYAGATVEYLRSPSSTDSWHHRNGYQHATKAVEGFIHSKKYGQVAKLIHNF